MALMNFAMVVGDEVQTLKMIYIVSNYQLVHTHQCNSPWIDLMVLVPWAKKHHMEQNVFRVNKIAIPKNREVPRMNNSLAYSPSCPCFSKTESISQILFCCNHVNANSEMLLHLTYISKANRYLRQSDCLHTFPRLIDICANQIAYIRFQG